MNNQDLNNNERIYELVANYFSMDNDSLRSFKEVLFENEKRMKYIDDIFHPMLHNSDLRIRFKIENSIKESLDQGWDIFKRLFYKFLEENNVKYENFEKNKIIIENSKEIKLFKYIPKWYVEKNLEIQGELVSLIKKEGISFYLSSMEDLIKKALEKIGTLKIPEGSLEAVASFNFADWFLVSTGEKYSSCLNLRSDYSACFWSGLPGLITDKNRILFYITDGKKKSYRGIVVDRIIARTWGILDQSGTIFPVKHYPSEIFSGEAFASLFNLPCAISNKTIAKDCAFVIGKHYYDNLLFNKLGESIYIYQDGTGFFIENKDGKQRVFIKSSSNGYYKIVMKKNNMILDEDTLYDYTEGLDGLINQGAELSDTLLKCSICGNYISEAFWGVDERSYCEDCYNERFSSCSVCGEIHYHENLINFNGDDFCEYCYNERFASCPICGETFYKSEMVYHDDGEYYCIDCYENEIKEEKCLICSKEFPVGEMIESGYDYVCKECYEKQKEKEKVNEPVTA